MLWKFQILTVLEVHELEDHVDQNSQSPPKTIQVSEDSSIVIKLNLAYKQWKRSDNLVFPWLVGIAYWRFLILGT